tara:strand:+ start:1401 stop:2342 length:942 start_codon:yes stop_codon:yes gene_type:complete
MGMRIIPQHPTHTVTAPFTVQEFLHKDNNPFYLREPIAESLSKDDLPYLYDVLSNPNRRDQWHNALLALCVLEDGPSALETVLSKVTQPWDWGEHVYKEYQPPFPLNERIRYLWNISMIEPALSVPFLAPLLSPEGATAFLESWGAMPLPSNALHEIDYLVGTVQRAAAYALIYTQSPAAVTPIADELQRQAGRTDSKGYWLESRTVFMLAGTLGLYDLLQDIGWEAGMRALREGQPTVGFGIASSYVEKRILEVDAITNIGPQRFWKRVVARHYESWLGLCVLIVVAILGTLAYRRIHHKTKTLPQYTDASS